METNRYFFDALGYLGYAVSRADGKVEEIETRAFNKAVRDNFPGLDPFNNVKKSMTTYLRAFANNYTSEQAYIKAMELFRKPGEAVLPWKEPILAVMKTVSIADSVFTDDEKMLVTRFNYEAEDLA